MSRIDLPRSTAGASLGSAGERIVPGTRRANGGILEIAPSAPRPRSDLGYGQQSTAQPERDVSLSAQAVRASDLAPLAGLETDRMIGELARIEGQLDSMCMREDEPVARQSYEIGRDAVGEFQRRLQVLNAGYSALVMKW